MQGKRVAFSKCGEEPGNFTIGAAYQQYCVTAAFQCIALPDDCSWEQGSMHCVNPMSALAMVEISEEHQTPAIIQTAAAS
jgi:NADPH:quinone reductase-like Zn-dependent oxidoreductase